MGWVTLSLRKMALKQRISNLEYRLVQLSQEQQSLANSSSYAQRELGMIQNQKTSQLSLNRMNLLKQARNNYSANSSDDSTNSQQSYLNLQTALDEINLNYQFEQMNMESIFQAQQDSMLQEINNRQQQLELEQVQVQDQLAAARAEEEQLSEAVSQDIKNDAIKLV